MKKSEFWSRYKYLVFFILIFSVSGVSIFKYVLTPEKKLPVYSPSMVNSELVSEDIQYKKKYHKISDFEMTNQNNELVTCLLYTSPSPRDRQKSRMPSSA